MRLLVISHVFPPAPHANAKRPQSVVRAALERGWQVDVVTGSWGMPEGAAETELRPGLRLNRVPDPVDIVCRRFARHFRLCRMLRLVFNGLTWPDPWRWWWRKAWRACRGGEGYDRVLAFILPASVLLSGRLRPGVDRRWVFDYQEPVTPFFEQLPRRSPLQRMLLPLLRRLERQTLHKAAWVVFTTEANRRAYIARGLVREEQGVHVPYFYDDRDFKLPAASSGGRFLIGYMGTFDWRGSRSPETFLRSLARFLSQTPEARSETQFLFRGPWLPEHNRFLDELGLRDVVSLQPPVDHREYIRSLRQCSVLLLVVSKEHSLFMPSKIVDYFGAGRPILGFAPADSEMRDVLRRAGMGDSATDETDVAGGARILGELWRRHRAGSLGVDRAATAPWSAQVQLPRYVKVLEEDLSSAVRPGSG